MRISERLLPSLLLRSDCGEDNYMCSGEKEQAKPLINALSATNEEKYPPNTEILFVLSSAQLTTLQQCLSNLN
jgi:hypothetical protein